MEANLLAAMLVLHTEETPDESSEYFSYRNHKT